MTALEAVLTIYGTISVVIFGLIISFFTGRAKSEAIVRNSYALHLLEKRTKFYPEIYFIISNIVKKIEQNNWKKEKNDSNIMNQKEIDAFYIEFLKRDSEYGIFFSSDVAFQARNLREKLVKFLDMPADEALDNVERIKFELQSMEIALKHEIEAFRIGDIERLHKKDENFYANVSEKYLDSAEEIEQSSWKNNIKLFFSEMIFGTRWKVRQNQDHKSKSGLIFGPDGLICWLVSFVFIVLLSYSMYYDSDFSVKYIQDWQLLCLAFWFFFMPILKAQIYCQVTNSTVAYWGDFLLNFFIFFSGLIIGAILLGHFF